MILDILILTGRFIFYLFRPEIKWSLLGGNAMGENMAVLA